MDYRIEHDSMGEVRVPADKYWGAQTERSRLNFRIGVDREQMPSEIIKAFGILKRACAEANAELVPERMSAEKLAAITEAAELIAAGELAEHFPLVVFQTGSGTQTNMNVNEVIAGYANEKYGKPLLHPNDDVNMSQSSNDTYPSAMHIAAYTSIVELLLPALDGLIKEFVSLEERSRGIIKSGRTHLQDATPIAFSQEVSGWRSSLERDKRIITMTAKELCALAIGGTAVGTGINAPTGYGELVAKKISEATGHNFISDENKFHALTSLDEMVATHGALKALACDLMKIANDIRFLASGPRLGLGEITIPANEPGSSIMPGKVNPTQCEAVTMVAARVIGNDTTVGLCASQGNFQLNVYLPITAYSFLQSVRLLAEAMRSFRENCVCGIEANAEKMKSNLHGSLMLATALNPHIGYENAAKTVKLAHAENLTLKDACVKLGYLSAERFDEIFKPEEMV